MQNRSVVLIFALAAALAACLAPLLQAQTAEASRPATPTASADDVQLKRLTFLGDQLAADEAAIAAINKSLAQAGYKASVATDRAVDAAKGNERMDRKGGAPVPWQQFYGRTARDFVMHDKDSSVYHQIQRPGQFDYVYRANDRQIDAAKSEIAGLGKKVDALLERRRQLEAEQCVLWASIAFESIQNREVPLRPLYRNTLKIDGDPGDDNNPTPPKLKAIRAAALYIRTVDRVITTVTERLESNPSSAFATVRDTLGPASDALREAAASFAEASADNARDADAAGQYKAIAAHSTQLRQLATDIAESHRKGTAADASAEEVRKQLYRGTLQESLFGFAEALAAFDDSTEGLASNWKVRAVPKTRTADVGPPIEITASEIPLGNSKGPAEGNGNLAHPEDIQVIPQFVDENLRALRNHRPGFIQHPGLSEQLDVITDAASRNDYAGFKKALAAAIKLTRDIRITEQGSLNSRDDVLAVLRSIEAGQSDLTRLAIHRRDHRDEKSGSPELIGLPGVAYSNVGGPSNPHTSGVEHEVRPAPENKGSAGDPVRSGAGGALSRSDAKPQASDDGWVELFNGKDLSGWTYGPGRESPAHSKGYRAVNGVLICGNGEANNLYTERDYRDFIVQFEFRLQRGANNGLGIRCPSNGDAASDRIEVQIIDDSSPLYKKMIPDHRHGSIWDCVAATPGSLKPVGQWNSEEVLVQGRRVRVVVNGKVILDANLDRDVTKPGAVAKHPGLRRETGKIALLTNSGETDFRNLRVKELGN